MIPSVARVFAKHPEEGARAVRSYTRATQMAKTEILASLQDAHLFAARPGVSPFDKLRARPHKR